jgi:hypothetical protein
VLDSLFTDLADLDRAPAPAAFPGRETFAAEPAEGSGVADTTEVPPPPPIETQADLQDAYELRERKRLEDYTKTQFTRLQSEHGAAITRNYLNEQALALRSQELRQQEQFLVQQSWALQQQARELAEREQALAGQREQLCRDHEGAAALDETGTGVRRDTDQQRTLLETLRAETAALQSDRLRALEDLKTLEETARQQREARAKQEALLAARQAHLEQRLLALDKSEEAVQQRLAELDDLEACLRKELEAEERRLAAERRSFEALAARLGP